MPGGKLVVVDLEVEDGRLDAVELYGDFFLEPAEAVVDRFVDTFRSCHGLTPAELDPEVRTAAERLAEKKFDTQAWTRLLP